ncbi:MAG: FAD-dependent oxidoreductase [Bermanella sp.]
MDPIIIIGAGHAGITLVRQIRMQDTFVPIIIIAKETVNHYYKPSLSKALSLGKEPDDLIMSSMAQLTQDLNVHILQHTEVTGVFPGKQKITLFCKDQTRHILPYQSLVFALGANAISLPIKGDADEHIYTVNNLADYQVFRQAINEKKRVLIIGAGFVGCEFASDLSQAGFKVDVIDRGQWPLQKAIPQALGDVIKDSMQGTNLTWHFDSQVTSIDKKTINNKKTVLEVKLSNNTTIETDVVLSAVGITPSIALAKKAGLATGRGIIINDFAQTNEEHIYALGDCAEYQDNLLPFIAPATVMAKSLAKTLQNKPNTFKIASLAVAIKISACPTIICPATSSEGQWKVTGQGANLEARFIDSDNNTLGFALTGSCTSNKQKLINECLPPFTIKNEFKKNVNVVSA